MRIAFRLEGGVDMVVGNRCHPVYCTADCVIVLVDTDWILAGRCGLVGALASACLLFGTSNVF